MTLPKKLYETLKFLKDFGFGMITIVTALLMAFGVADSTISIVTICITGACQAIIAFINACSKNHWKAVAEDGTTEEIESIESEDSAK